jgi:hypothetical protein
MERFDLNYMDLSGGLNLGPSPSDIQDTEVCSLVNYLPVASDLRLRPGFRRIAAPYDGGGSAVAFPTITGLHDWAGGNPREWELFAGTLTNFARWIPATDTWTRIPRTDALSPGDYSISDEPWCMLQYRGIVYAFRRDVGMRRLSRSPLDDSPPGIPAPTGAPTLAAGAAGDIPAANFQGMVTFYNSATGAESNPSPASAVYAHAGALMISWTGLPTTAPAGVSQVTHIRLYRTLPDKTSTVPDVAVGYLVTTLPLGTASYATDNLLVEQLGGSVSRKNNRPPPVLRSGVIWQDRLWAHDGRQLYVSEIGKPESMPSVNVLQVFPDDGQEIVGLAADETRLFIGKDASVRYLTGSVPNLELHVLDEKNGVTSQHTMKSLGGRLVWRSPKDVLISEGGAGNSLTAGRKLRTYMDHVVGSAKYTEVAEVIPERNLYVFMGRYTAKTAAQLGHPHAIADRDFLAVNYETGAWGMIRLPFLDRAPAFFKRVIDQNGDLQFFLGWGATLQRDELGRYEDDVPNGIGVTSETAIRSELFPRETTAPPGHLLAPRSLWLDSTLRSIPTSFFPSQQFELIYHRDGQYGSPVGKVPIQQVLAARGDQVFGLKTIRNASRLLVGFVRRGIAQSFDVFGIGLGGWKIARRHRPVS